MIYLDIDIRPFPYTRKDKGYFIFIDKMKEGSGNTIERNVLECGSKKDIDVRVKRFISTYTKEYHYIKLWRN